MKSIANSLFRVKLSNYRARRSDFSFDVSKSRLSFRIFRFVDSEVKRVQINSTHLNIQFLWRITFLAIFQTYLGNLELISWTPPSWLRSSYESCDTNRAHNIFKLDSKSMEDAHLHIKSGPKSTWKPRNHWTIENELQAESQRSKILLSLPPWD